MRPVGSGSVLGPKVVGGLQTRLGARLDRASHRVCQYCQFAQPDRLIRNVGHAHYAVHQLQLLLRCPQHLAGQSQHLDPYPFGRGVDGIGGHDGAPTGKGASAPMEMGRVASHNVYVAHIHAQLVRHNLGKSGKVTLPLRADTGGHAHLATGLNGDAGTLIGPHTGGLDEGNHADAHVPALGPQSRLLLLDELLILDHVEGSGQGCRVVAAVDNELGKGLIYDLVVVGEGIGLQEVPPADFSPVYVQLFGSDVQ